MKEDWMRRMGQRTLQVLCRRRNLNLRRFEKVRRTRFSLSSPSQTLI